MTGRQANNVAERGLSLGRKQRLSEDAWLTRPPRWRCLRFRFCGPTAAFLPAIDATCQATKNC